jgi:hypothetical protein
MPDSQAAARWALVAAIALLALAMTFHAAASRYTTVNAGSGVVVRTDRLTGGIAICDVGEAVPCAPAKWAPAP